MKNNTVVKILNRHSNWEVESISGKEIIRCQKLFDKRPYQIIYVDLTNNWLEVNIEDKSLERYLESVLLKDYYQHIGYLQWNYYYAFISNEKDIESNYQKKNIIENLIDSGIETVNIITGYNGDLLEKSMKKLPLMTDIHFFNNKEWEKGNGTSAFCSHNLVKSDNFILTMADHWFMKEITQKINKYNLNYNNLLAVDRSIENINDIDDATKVKTGKNNLIEKIDKNLKNYDAIDSGIFKFYSKDIFPSLEASFSRNDYSLSGGIKDLISKENMNYIDIEGSLWQDIDTISDLDAATEKIKKGIRNE